VNGLCSKKYGAKKAAEIEEREKQKWIEIENTLKQMKNEGKWLDYYDFQKLKEAERRRNLNDYSPEPEYVPVRSSSSKSSTAISNKPITSKRGKDGLYLALLLTFMASSVPAFALGAHFMNWAAVIYGLIVLAVGWALVAKYESGGGGGHGHHYGYYYGAASSAGRGFRMWSVDRVTRRRR
jgi:hypothetical protein